MADQQRDFTTEDNLTEDEDESDRRRYGRRRVPQGEHSTSFACSPSLIMIGISVCVAVTLMFMDHFPSASAQEMTPSRDLVNDATTSTKICGSFDIRNNVENLESLRGCRVVEGFVQILLFDSADEKLADYSFPDLVEITDYLLFYRVNGLVSLGQLFPNLTVIRGRETVFGYAFALYEMNSIRDIGLYSLTDIVQGAVRIDKNPSLCHLNSIDWDLICHEKGEHFIKSVKPEHECPLCEGETDQRLNCSGIPSGLATNDRPLCWNRHHCQKVCPRQCKRACNSRGECCDSKCLGGCSDHDIFDCTVCRNFTFGSENKRKCVSECPPGFFEFLGRRCVRREECIGFPRPLSITSSKIQHEHPYLIYNNRSCVLQCPPNYMADYENHECKKCQGKCQKECPGTNIDSIESAKQLHGCTLINGSLEIQIRGGRNVAAQLEENLYMIEEVTGYIKIARSYPLVSLNFFKKLRIVRGYQLENQQYVFIALDNQNLQEIWDWQNRTLQIDNGRLFFHFNPKLCPDKIKELQKRANLSKPTELEVADSSNGDKIACDVKELNVTVTQRSPRAILLQWPQFHMDDSRKLLGYVVYSIEAPEMNVTMYDGRDACGGDGWRLDDVTAQNQTMLVYILTQLKPHTQYAFYVKTYTIATERSGAQSPIQYARTKPDEPSRPADLTVTTNSSDSLLISWKRPLEPNGNVTSYIVTGEKDISGRKSLTERDGCQKSLTMTPDRREKVTLSSLKKAGNDSTCKCDDPLQKGGKSNEDERESQIDFEDRLYNLVYIKNINHQDSGGVGGGPSVSRSKRDAIEFPESVDKHDTKNVTVIQNVTESGIWVSFNFTVRGATELYVSKLHHYTKYKINVQACRERELDDTGNLCSDDRSESLYTKMKAGADTVQNLRITNQTLNSITIAWEKPQDPNGVILSYEIEYNWLEVDNSRRQYDTCVPQLFDDSNRTMTYKLGNMPTGNYSLRLRARSQYSYGDYSAYVYFSIPEPNNHSYKMIGIGIGVCAIGFILVVMFCIVIRRQARNDSLKLVPNINPNYQEIPYVPDEWEVNRSKVECLNELGQGSFGMVYEGVVRNIRGKAHSRCAVKTINEHATKSEIDGFLCEATRMKKFDTTHVVKLLGVVSDGQPLVIMELMEHGDLRSYLRSHRPNSDMYITSPGHQPPSLKQILQMAIEIADGMAYLAAMKYVHRDLAARNCMVGEDLTVKIGDFGMTRDVYETDYYRKGSKGLLPVRWMAPESLQDGVFTSSSDVWSYGVVLWEMATLASQPYQGLTNNQVLRYVIDGGIMERPESCPDKLYDLMTRCWRHKPQDRLSFLDLCGLLSDDAKQTFGNVSFYHSTAGVEARNSKAVAAAALLNQRTQMLGVTGITVATGTVITTPHVTPMPMPGHDENGIDPDVKVYRLRQGVGSKSSPSGALLTSGPVLPLKLSRVGAAPPLPTELNRKLYPLSGLSSVSDVEDSVVADTDLDLDMEMEMDMDMDMDMGMDDDLLDDGDKSSGRFGQLLQQRRNRGHRRGGAGAEAS